MERDEAVRVFDRQWAELDEYYDREGYMPREMPQGEEDWHTDAYWTSCNRVFVKNLYQIFQIEEELMYELMARRPEIHALLDVTRPPKPTKTQDKATGANETEGTGR